MSVRSFCEFRMIHTQEPPLIVRGEGVEFWQRSLAKRGPPRGPAGHRRNSKRVNNVRCTNRSNDMLLVKLMQSASQTECPAVARVSDETNAQVN